VSTRLKHVKYRQGRTASRFYAYAFATTFQLRHPYLTRFVSICFITHTIQRRFRQLSYTVDDDFTYTTIIQLKRSSFLLCQTHETLSLPLQFSIR
jgi:hypothetical protein